MDRDVFKMKNDTELVEFYKWLSEIAIIDDCYRGEGDAECAVSLYNKAKTKISAKCNLLK